MIFAAILMGVTFFTGIIWLLDIIFFSKSKFKNNKIIDNIKVFSQSF